VPTAITMVTSQTCPSYDYDAPLDESGRPRPKYFRLRSLINEVTHQTPIPVPDSPPLTTVPTIRLNSSLPLWDTLQEPIKAAAPYRWRM